MRDIDVPGEHRTGNEELRSRNWRAVLDELILNRQLELLREVHRGIAHRDYGAAALDERADLRDGAIAGDASELRSELRGNVRRVRTAGTSPAAAAAPTACGNRARGNRARRQDQHVVLRVEIAGVELRRKNARERELELLENPSRPPGLDRAAVLIPQRDTRGAHRSSTCRTGLQLSIEPGEAIVLRPVTST